MNKECPCCHEEYETALDRKHPEILIQQEFPEAPVGMVTFIFK